MKSSNLKALAVLCTLAGMVLGFAWFIVSMLMGGDLLMNGPWFIAVLVCAIGVILAFASMVAEERERREARERTKQLIEAAERARRYVGR